MRYIDIIFKAVPDILFKYLPLVLSIFSICFSVKNKFNKLEKNRQFLLDKQKGIRRLIKCIDDLFDLDLQRDNLDDIQYNDISNEIHVIFDDIVANEFHRKHKLPAYDSSKNNISNGYYQTVYKTAKKIDDDISESINKIDKKQFKTIQH